MRLSQKNKTCLATNGRMAKTATSIQFSSQPFHTSVVMPKLTSNGQLTRRWLSSASAETMSFQAETRKLLDIVTNSIYTDKEVFIRELISNSSDALEKFRYYQVKGEVKSPEATTPQSLEINIWTDQEKNTLTILDSGIGMSKEELVSNLGTIARSGSKQFVEQFKTGESASSANTEGIIGQFGVGFYSSFMVSDAVSVESRSATADTNPHKWSSDGSGVFQIEAVDNIDGMATYHGSKITMKLKDSCKEFSDPERIKRYSIFLNLYHFS